MNRTEEFAEKLLKFCCVYLYFQWKFDRIIWLDLMEKKFQTIYLFGVDEKYLDIVATLNANAIWGLISDWSGLSKMYSFFSSEYYLFWPLTYA